MADPNMVDFYKRAARLERDRARGRGFEAPGALGRSYYYRSTSARRSVLWPALFLVAAGFLLKGGILYATGTETYQARVNDLQAAPGMVEQAGAWLMQADPLTVWVSEKIAEGVTRLRT